MKLTQAAGATAIATGLYLLVLIWADTRNHVFALLPQVTSTLPILLLLSSLSYLLRYARWHCLLLRAQAPVPVLRGLLAYLAGFAFTATPGKVGELVRIRYFRPMGVPPARILACFVLERAWDVIVLILMASTAVHELRLFLLLLGFVGGLLAALIVAIWQPLYLRRLSAALYRHRSPRLARTVRTLRQGLAGCRVWLNLKDMLLCLVLGILAWGLTALAFVWLLLHIGVELPLSVSVSIYPTAMLAGAASMLPAGIGTTEATIVTLLALHAVPFGTATLAAVGIRLASLWFAVACGFASLGLLEHLQHRKPK